MFHFDFDMIHIKFAVITHCNMHSHVRGSVRALEFGGSSWDCLSIQIAIDTRIPCTCINRRERTYSILCISCLFMKDRVKIKCSLRLGAISRCKQIVVHCQVEKVYFRVKITMTTFQFSIKN